MEEMPVAKVCHAIRFRTRIRLPEKKGDIVFFHKAEQRLGEHPDIRSVSVNANTASILLTHQEALTFAEIQAFAAEHQLFQLASDNEEPDSLDLRRYTAESYASLNRWLKRLSNGELDYQTLLLLVFFGMAVVQIARGKVMAPAASLLWYVITLINSRRNGDNSNPKRG